jgi:fructose-1,6-bisphosphatase I
MDLKQTRFLSISVLLLLSSFLLPAETFSLATTRRLQQSTLFSALDPIGAEPSLNLAKTRKKKNLKTFSRFLEVKCWKEAHLRSLEPCLIAVADACKQITRIIQRANTDDVYGVATDAQGNPLVETNVQGEVQQKLDVLCNTILMRAFCGSSKHIRAVASEEEDKPRCCADVMVRGQNVFLVAKRQIQ